jgi:hypothetical protein
VAHFEYDGGRAVRFFCSTYEGQECPDTEMHRQVHEHMINWINNMPGQARVRRAKIDRLYGADVDLGRVLNE